MKITASTSRVRTSFDPGLELPKLHQWFAQNPHPSRVTLQAYVNELNSLSSRQSRRLLEVHNLCYWFKNARAAYKRAELRMKKNQEQQQQQQQQQQSLSSPSGSAAQSNGVLTPSASSSSSPSSSNGSASGGSRQQQQQVAMQVDAAQEQPAQVHQPYASASHAPANGSMEARVAQLVQSRQDQRFFGKSLVSSKSSPQINDQAREAAGPAVKRANYGGGGGGSSSANGKIGNNRLISESQVANLMSQLSSIGQDAANGFREAPTVGNGGEPLADGFEQYGRQTVRSASDTDANSGIVCIESPSRDDSTSSPASTVSLPAMATLCQSGDGNGSATGTELVQRPPQHPAQHLHPQHHHQQQQQQHQHPHQHQHQQQPAAPVLSNVDLANAVNYILSTATNFTAAAAAAAAATAASTTLTSSPLQPASNLMQLPSSAAINLALSLLNSNLINNSGQIVADPGAFAAALNNRCGPAFAAPADPVAAAAAAMAGVAMVDQPVRQLFTAFNPSSYNFALGMLDNKLLDANILNSMSFPTSACAPEPLGGGVGAGGFAQNGLASQLVAGRTLGGSHGNLSFNGNSSVTQLPTEWTETMIRQAVLALTQNMSQLTLSKLCNISQPLISSIVRGGKKLGRKKCIEFGQWYMNYMKSAEARPATMFCEGGGARLVFDKTREIPQLKNWFANNMKPSDKMLEEYSKILNEHALRKDRPQVTAKALKNWWKNERQKLGIRQREIRGRPKLKKID